MVGNYADTMNKLYENFFMRDFVYIGAGCVFLFSIGYYYSGNFESIMNYFTQNIFKFIIFLIFSYFAGVIIQEGTAFLGIVKTGVKAYKPFNEYTFLINEARRKYGLDIIIELERIIHFKQIGSAIGSASLSSSFVLLLSFTKYHRHTDLIVLSALVVVTVICLKENRWKLRQQNELLKHIAENMTIKT